MFGRRRKISKNVPLDELVPWLTMENAEPRTKKTFKEKLGFFRKLMGLALSIGLLFTVFPLTGAAASAIIAKPASDWWKTLPSALPDHSVAQKNTLYDVNGNVFAEVWSENRSELSSLDQISPWAKKALLDTEDRHFYQNSGIDIKGTIRAALLRSGGGSGITQQLVKNLQFYDVAGTDQEKEQATEKTLTRKLKELKLAVNYEKSHSKDEILLNYFNTIAFGSPSIYSLESASQYFFGVSAKDLDIAQASALIGTVQNPVIYNMDVDDNTSTWKERQKVVLDNMVAMKDITQEQADAAYQEALPNQHKSSSGKCSSSAYPFYCDYVMSYLSSSTKLASTQQGRDTMIAKGGLKIQTYMDPGSMKKVNDSLKADFSNNADIAGTTAVVQPGSGGVSAIGSNLGYGSGPGQTFINIPLNPAASGSTFKVFTLAAALNSGMTESQLAFSSPCAFAPAGFDYPPGGITNSNGCGFQSGYMDYKKAIAYSSNTWFATLESKIGVDTVKNFTNSVGLRNDPNVTSRSLSYTLGVTENSPVALAAADATFANQGVYCPPTPVKSYSYADGSSPAVPDDYDPSVDSCKAVMSPQSASIVLRGMRANSSGEVQNSFGMGYTVPGHDTVTKSGTSENSGYSWVQLAGQAATYTTVYNYVDTSGGAACGKIKYKGVVNCGDVAQYAGFDIVKSLLNGQPNAPLDYNNTSTTFKNVSSGTKEFVTVPSVVGMSPDTAVSTIQQTGLTVNVSKNESSTSGRYPTGIIIAQSVAPGTKIAVGSKKEVTLTVSK